MIERVVVVKLKKGADRDTRSDVARYSREALRKIPGVMDVRAAVACDERSAAGWDLCFTVRFASLADVEGYVGHPDHRAYVDQYLRPKIESIAAHNFEV